MKQKSKTFDITVTPLFQSWECHLFVAYTKEGSVTVSVDDEDKKVYLFNVYVTEGARHQGLATALMKAAVAECERLGLHDIKLWCVDRLRPFYEQFGFKYTGTFSVPRKPDEKGQIEMIKP